MKYFDNDEINDAFNACFAWNPATAKHPLDDDCWYKFFLMLFENNLGEDADYLQQKLKAKQEEKADEKFDDETLSKIVSRYEDLNGFYTFLKEEGRL